MGQTPSNPRRRITPQDRAILDMKVQRDKLRQYQLKIQTILDREHEIAKECLKAGHKPKAILALRRRKYQESLLSKTDSQLAQLEKLTQTVEFALVEKDVLYGLRQGNAVLREINREMSLESVEKLMEDTADAQAHQREVNEMLAGVMSNAEEDEVEEELEKLEREMVPALSKEHSNVQIILPNIPNTEPEDLRSEEVKKYEMAKMRAWKRKQELLERQPAESTPA